MKNAISPAKITAPVPGEIVHRERLYRILDKSTELPITCISAPAGYGKTTLVSAYVKRRELPCLWYKVDASDGDVSTFFYHLGAACRKITGIKKSMPLLKPEYQQGMPAFTRNYFRELFSRLAPGSVIVFDNYQDAGKDAVLYDLMLEVIQEVPQGYRLIFISREKPPCGFAKSNANGDVLKINSELLALTYEESIETATLLGVNKETDVDLLRKIHACTKGWVTGFKLVLNRKDDLKDIDVDLEEASQDIVFEYFMEEVLSRLDAGTRMFLFKVSTLPIITISLARQLTGLVNAKKILNDLVQKQFFTTRHGRFKPIYEFHPLFNKFLSEQCVEQLTQSELEDLYNTSGLLLADAGDYENAIELLIRSQSWDAIIKLLEKHSKKLIDQGRNLQLIRWFEVLPQEKTLNKLWLNYWHGMALMNYENSAARNKFINTYNLAKQNGDAQGLYLSWCGIADSFTFDHSNFTESIPWVKELHWLRESYPKYPSIEARARLILSAAMLLVWVDPASLELMRWMKKVELIYKVIPNKTIRTLCGVQLILDYGQKGEVTKLRHASASLKKYVNHEEVPDFLSLFIETILVACDYLTADFKLSNEEIDSAYKRYEDVGLSFFNGFVLAHSIYHAELKNNEERVRKLLDNYRKNISEDSDLDLGHYHHHEAVYSMMIGDAGRAVQHAQMAIELTVTAYAPYPEAICRTMGAYVYVESGQLDQANIELDVSETIFKAYKSHASLALILLIRALIAFKSDEKDKMLQYISHAFDIFHEKDIRSLYLWPHKLINDSCAIALQNNIRPDFVKQIIAIYKYTPQNNLCITENWPYPVKIYTLNRFGVIKDNQALRLSDKNQKFIKALISFGGRDVHEEVLSDALWPDAEGDAAHQNFATTLHRVRKVVGSEVLQLRQNRVSLNPDYCWIDVWALKREMSEIEKSLLNSNHNLSELIRRAINLYQGDFLGVDGSDHWVLVTRERLRNNFLRILNDAAEAYCDIKECTQALNCYEKGLEIDDLSENIYQKLIHCHTCIGNHAQAVVTYEQCCRRLKDNLGIDPSSKTEQLYQALKNH